MRKYTYFMPAQLVNKNMEQMATAVFAHTDRFASNN